MKYELPIVVTEDLRSVIRSARADDSHDAELQSALIGDSQMIERQVIEQAEERFTKEMGNLRDSDVSRSSR